MEISRRRFETPTFVARLSGAAAKGIQTDGAGRDLSGSGHILSGAGCGLRRYGDGLLP